MELFRDHQRLPDEYQGAVITMGNFDGIHKGHQKLFKQVIERAKQLGKKSLVITFYPHPVKFLHPEKELELITTFEDKIKIIESLGIDGLLCFDFTREFASTSPEDFIKKYIVDLIKPSEIYVGSNFTFGKERMGNVDFLIELGKKYNFKVNVVDILLEDGIQVSSTLIRNLIYKGKVDGARKLMGRAFSISGIVVKKSQRGQKLGFPTCNIVPEGVIIPAKGVYAAMVETPFGNHKAAVYVGNRPSFDGGETLIEAFLIEFKGNLYRKKIRVNFLEFIRPEMKFNSMVELKKQIEIDVAKVEEYFEKGIFSN